MSKAGNLLMKKLSKLLTISMISMVSWGLMSCVTTVNRVDTQSNIDVSGNWNDVDSRLVSEQITTDILSQPWYARYVADISRSPVIIVGGVRNDSSEHINTNTFVKDIERAMVNSARLEVVASADQQSILREQRAEQDLYVSEETRKRLGNELGADVIMVGSISTIEDVEGKRSVRYYQVDVELIDIETNRKLWIGQKKIKKFVRKPSVRL